MQRSENINELAAALAKAQMAMEGARKDKTNPHFKSAYADMASVWEAIRDPMAAAGLAVIQFPRTVENGIEVETMLTHASGQFVSDVLWMPCKQMDAHGVGSAITYGRRYALMAVAGIAPVDDDGNGAATGAPGTAGGGGQFRPPGRRDSSANGRTMAADEPQLVDTTREKGKLPAGTGRQATPEEARAAKIKAATDKRIKALKDGPWTPDTLKQFWDGDVEWRTWMTDANNEALAEWERYTTAYDDARDLTREAA